MAEEKKGKDARSGLRAPKGPEREEELEDAMHEINGYALDALNPLSVLHRLFDPRQDFDFDDSTMFEIGDMVIRAYEASKSIFNTVTHTI